MTAPYTALVDDIAADIAAGRLKPGERLPPQRQFAYEKGIAASTVYPVTFPSGPFWSVTALFSFFLLEYLFFERVHLYTYDFFAERVGFKLGWGCLCFYPYFYAIGLWSVADRPNPHAATATLVIWLLARTPVDSAAEDALLQALLGVLRAKKVPPPPPASARSQWSPSGRSSARCSKMTPCRTPQSPLSGCMNREAAQRAGICHRHRCRPSAWHRWNCSWQSLSRRA